MAKGKILKNGTWIEIDAANADKLGGQLPSYYAIKGTQNVTSVGDWNNVITNGFYDGQNMTNACPSETNHTWRYCVVHNHSANGTNWVTQTMWDFAGGAKYERQKASGTWSPWRKILDQRDYDTLFSSVSSGKAQVATAITGKGGTVSGTAPYTFQQLADGVNSIQVGKYKIGDTITYQNLGLDRPPMVSFDQLPTRGSYNVTAVGVDASGYVWMCWLDGYLRKYTKKGALIASFSFYPITTNSKMIIIGNDIYIIIINSGSSNIQKWDATTGTKVKETILSAPSDMDIAGGYIYVVGLDSTYKIDASSLSIVWANTTTIPSGYDGAYIAVEKATGTYAYIEYNTPNGSTNYIKKVLTSNGADVWTNKIINSRNKSIGIYNDGALYFQGGKYDANFNKLWQYSPSTGANWFGPVQVFSNNDVVFSASDNGTGALYKLNSAGNLIWHTPGLFGDVLGGGGSDFPNALYYDSVEGCYYASSYFTKRVFEKIQISG